jgi:DNA polymerase III subunit delta
MEPRELERRLKRQQLAPVIFLWGEESLLIDEAVRQIEALVLDPAVREFNRDFFYGDEAEPQAIVNAAQTLPWLAAQRLVVVRGTEALPRAADAALVTYCKQPSSSTCLIFMAQRLEGSRALFSTLAKLPWAVRFKRLLPRELSTWVEQRVAAGNCKITPDAVMALIETTGNDLRMLASEIDKLVVFVGPAQTIDVGNLEAVSADVRETSAFELARLLSAGDLAGAIRAWEKFSASGEYPGLALGALIHHVRQLWRIKLLQAKGATPDRMAGEIGAPIFTVRRLSTQAAALDAGRLRQWLEALFEADQLIKRSGLSTQSVFERLILRFCVEDRASQAPR